MARRPVPTLIQLYSRQLGLDPRAVRAVAQGEGGLGWGAVGDGGHAFGPFQMNDAGGVLTGRFGSPAARARYANSEAGVFEAMRSMANAGARGKTGQAAVRAIVYNYERPADKAGSFQKAMSRYGKPGVSVPITGTGYSGRPGVRVAGSQPDVGAAKSALLQQLTGSVKHWMETGELDTGRALTALEAYRKRTTAVPQTGNIPSRTKNTEPHNFSTSQDPGGMDPDFNRRLNAMIRDSGGRLSISSGYRSVAEQRKLWAGALAKYGSVEAARRWVAPPGKSNHNHGIAADLRGDLNWAHANAARYGLHFPMSWEAWHIEPMGSRRK